MADQTVLPIGALDTKVAEHAFLRERLALAGLRPLLVDVGTLEPRTTELDVSREEVAAATGLDLAATPTSPLRARGRGRADGRRRGAVPVRAGQAIYGARAACTPR